MNGQAVAPATVWPGSSVMASSGMHAGRVRRYPSWRRREDSRACAQSRILMSISWVCLLSFECFQPAVHTSACAPGNFPQRSTRSVRRASKRCWSSCNCSVTRSGVPIDAAIFFPRDHVQFAFPERLVCPLGNRWDRHNSARTPSARGVNRPRVPVLAASAWVSAQITNTAAAR